MQPGERWDGTWQRMHRCGWLLESTHRFGWRVAFRTLSTTRRSHYPLSSLWLSYGSCRVIHSFDTYGWSIYHHTSMDYSSVSRTQRELTSYTTWLLSFLECAKQLRRRKENILLTLRISILGYVTEWMQVKSLTVQCMKHWRKIPQGRWGRGVQLPPVGLSRSMHWSVLLSSVGSHLNCLLSC